MPFTTTSRKTKAATATKVRKTMATAGTKVPTREAIAKAVQDYLAANYDSLLVHAGLAHSPALDAMFAEIDRNLEASEQITARLRAQD
jgi:hypothetical protein